MIKNMTIETKISKSHGSADSCCRLYSQSIKFSSAEIDAFQFEMVLREALNNAVDHSGEKKSGQLIDITLKIDENLLELTINDHGVGFDWRMKMEQIISPFLVNDKITGRGLFIINRYSDEINFNESGNILTIKKIVAPRSGPKE